MWRTIWAVLASLLTVSLAGCGSEQHATPGEHGAVLLFHPVVSNTKDARKIVYDTKKEIAVRVVVATLGPRNGGWGWGKADGYRGISIRFSAEDRERLRQVAAAHPADMYIFWPQSLAGNGNVEPESWAVRTSDMEDGGFERFQFAPGGNEERVFKILCGRYP